MTRRPKTEAQVRSELRQFRQAFGMVNGTKWFCQAIPFRDAQNLHQRLTGGRASMASVMAIGPGQGVNIVDTLKSEARSVNAGRPQMSGNPRHEAKGFEGLFKLFDKGSR